MREPARAGPQSQRDALVVQDVVDDPHQLVTVRRSQRGTARGKIP